MNLRPGVFAALISSSLLFAAACGGEDPTGGPSTSEATCHQPGGSCTREQSSLCPRFSCTCVTSGCAAGPIAASCVNSTCKTQQEATSDCDVICDACGGAGKVESIGCQ